MTGLSKKEKGFVKDFVETGNGVQSALNNYDTESYSTAGVIAHDNLKKPKIINAIQEALPDELLATVHLEGLKASKTYQGKDDDSETILEPDYAVRHKYLDSAYKLKGLYAPEKSINLNVEAEITNPEAKKLAEKYEEELKKGL